MSDTVGVGGVPQHAMRTAGRRATAFQGGQVSTAELPEVSVGVPHDSDLDVVTRYDDATAQDDCRHWAEVVQAGAGRTVVIAGTVLDAPDLRSAVLRLRTAARAYARLDLSPADVLTHLDALLVDVGELIRSTCVYLVCDSLDDTVTCASAGHPPPLLCTPDGAVAPLPVLAGTTIGAGGAAFHDALAAAPAGSALAVLIGGVGPDLASGPRNLRLHSAEPAELTERLWEFVDAPGEGAVLVMATRPAGGQGGVRVIELELAEGDDPTRRARAFCFGVLSTWQLPAVLRDDIVLAVSELVANALLHGGAAEQLRIRRTPRRVVVEVFDREPTMPRPRIADADAESGRGLQLVRRVASRWGARPVPDGKAVWCEFDLMSAARIEPQPVPG